MNPDVFLDFSQVVQELSKSVNRIKKNKHNSHFQYGDAYEYDNGYEPKYQDFYNTCNPLHQFNKSFVLTTLTNL